MYKYTKMCLFSSGSESFQLVIFWNPGLLMSYGVESPYSGFCNMYIHSTYYEHST